MTDARSIPHRFDRAEAAREVGERLPRAARGPRDLGHRGHPREREVLGVTDRAHRLGPQRGLDAEQLLLAVEQCCDRINDSTDADVDSQRSGGMITLTFPNRTQIIINQQKPLHEIWMAAKSGGYHYKFEVADGAGTGQWMDTKGAGEFFACLTRDASQQSGMSLQFSA